ncbi:MAG: hypothetical protein HY362_00825 [Candidatus Aenigmarchaeota archaeon]|nr:hypothetical protein [Candidatus Aenigmarchaeota archaeon]
MPVYNRARFKVSDKEVVPARVRHVDLGRYQFDVVLPGGVYGGHVMVLQPDGDRKDQAVGRRYYHRDVVITLDPTQYRPPVPSGDPLHPSSGTPVRVSRDHGIIKQGTRRIGWVANPDSLPHILEALDQIPDEKPPLGTAKTILGKVVGRRITPTF